VALKTPSFISRSAPHRPVWSSSHRRHPQRTVPEPGKSDSRRTP
jgi:hypothetical protein